MRKIYNVWHHSLFGSDFLTDILAQIREDIEDYQSNYPHIEKIKEDSWAFNFWILDRFYSIDEQLIEDLIIDYNDMGIDCYVWHEDTRDLYLIQNKYFSTSTLTTNYVNDHFLVRPVGALKNGTYSHCPELQTIFSKFRDDPDFTVHLQLYVTENPSHPEKIESIISDFNTIDSHYIAHVYWLNDIAELYFGKQIKERTKMDFNIESVKKTSILSVNTKEWGLPLEIDAKYVFAPVLNLYELCKKAHADNYPLFDENIRDYLGSKVTVNKGIRETLMSPDDCKNFFYYNNGITMIVDDMGKIETNINAYFKVKNPKIVNGCQTVSTIYETISSQPVSNLSQFEDAYVMIKVLKIPSNEEQYQSLKDKIVTYNNSQNAIDQKTFVSLTNEFKRLQIEFKKKGFLICIKQSDDNQFKEQYKSPSKLLEKNIEYLDKFGITGRKTKDFIKKLEKVLQVFVAFDLGFFNAVQKKRNILNPDSDENKSALSFIKNDATTNDRLNLFLLYLRSEEEKKNSEEGNMLIPMMLISCFARYQCLDDAKNISKCLETKEDVDNIILYYSAVISQYYEYWKERNGDKGYNELLKEKIDWELMDKSYNFFKKGPYSKFVPKGIGQDI